MSRDEEKLCAQTIVFQVKAANGHWINWKAASRSPDEEWDMDAVNKVKPEFRFITETDDDLSDYINDEHDDTSLKRPFISEETRRERVREAILAVASVAPDLAPKVAAACGVEWPLL